MQPLKMGQTSPILGDALALTAEPFQDIYQLYYVRHCRRKFRSQTSDTMDRWKSRGVKSKRGEAKK